jgi:amino acid adenylation domain-containing protein/non-ribosomal peptide synthase protein (TIGR01720 family)
MTTGLENVEDVYALTPMQQGMLFHAITEPGSGVFVDQIAARLRGPLDVPRFTRAWSDVVRRHAALRTAFLWDGLDEPLQVVRGTVEVGWTQEDWTDLDEAARERRLEALLERDRHRDFELAAAPLVRMTLAREAASAWRWVWTFHHLILDGWSASVVLRELLAIYDALGRGAAPALETPFPYRDYIGWHATRDPAAAEDFWRRTLGGFDAPTRLSAPDAAPDAAPDGAGGHRQLHRVLPTDVTARLGAMATAQRVTVSGVVQAAWALLLARLSRERDVVFGVTTSGRPPELDGVDRGVGLFINTLPLRVDVDPAARVGDWLREVQRRQVAVRELEHSALASVQRWSDVAPGEPLFESIVVFENYPQGAALKVTDLEIADLDFREQSNYPLAVLVLPGPELGLTFVHDAARLDAGTVGPVADRLLRLLELLADAPDARLGEVSLVDADEERRLLVEWNETGMAAPPEGLAHARFEAAARARPDAVAVVADDSALTYAELDRAANRLAHRLRAGGVGPDVRVGLGVERTLDLAVGILGILKAGGAYVPLDPGYPAAHLRVLVEESEPAVLLAPSALLGTLPSTGVRMAIDEDVDLPPEAGARPPETTTQSDHLAYVIFTSGSTGRPRGVMVTHGNLVHSTAARDAFYDAAVGRFLLLSSFTFDSSVAGIFWTLCTGGTLVLPAPGVEQDMDRLLDLIRRREVTHLLGLPTLYGLLLEHARAGDLDGLRVAIVAGEACPADVVTRHFATAPECALANEYGPTEATVWSVAHRLAPADGAGPVPIGRPVPNMQAHVLDEGRRLVPVGFPGELYLAGPGIARGYLGDEELTAERFVTVALPGAAPCRMYRTGDLVRRRRDGALVFLGRTDAQIKIRGHRIEIAAVEAALRAHPAVADAAAAGRGAKGRARLVGYVVGAHGRGGAVEPTALRSELATTLPAFMVPDVVVRLDALPRTATGKTDYRALPPPTDGGADTAPAVPPRTPEERALADIWSALLGVDAVGVHDDFFQLGGDSILTIQVISRARQQGLDIAPRQIAEHPTIAQLAAVAGTRTRPSTAEDVPTGPAPLTPIQAWFLDLELAAPHHWNQSGLFEVGADVDVDALDAAWRACLAHHDALRARFRRDGGAWRQEIVEAGAGPDAALAVIDLDGGSDGEAAAAREIERAQSTLDLGAGPLARAVLLRRRGAPAHRLVIAVHHLVIDVVSWSILLDDLELAYGQRRRGAEIDLPPRTTSYRRWARRLAALADSDALREEIAYWNDPDAAAAGALPLAPGAPGAVTEAAARPHTTRLDAERTRALLTDVNDAYRTRVEDLLVTALARAVARLTGRATVRLELEGHGRPDDLDDVDLTRTVGWFTTSYPVTMPVADDDAGAALMRAKETLRGVPGHGIGWGVLRSMTDAGEMPAFARPAILLNYLGRIAPPAPAAVLRRISGLEASSRDPRSVRPHPLEVIAAVRDDRLVLDWVHGETQLSRETVERVAGWFEEELIGLIDHCRSAGTGGFTPSDFPDADLDQEELDRFLESLGE